MSELQDFLKLGIVTNVDEEKRLARVKFPGMGLQDTSGWLPVLINRDRIGVDVKEWSEEQWTEFDTEWKGSRSGFPDYADHKHKLVIKPYMPMVGDQVLVVYFPIFNADGFILGGIKPWR